jgi:hypothetical protein
MPWLEYAMRALRDAQTDFFAAVLGRDPAQAASWPGRRLAVYRTNARENFAAALEAAFPLLHGLMGHDEFRAMSWAFQQSCPSRSGNQFYCGVGLTGFLAAHLAGTPDAPLAVVADFEWQIQQVLVAADAPASFDFARLAAVPETAHGSLRFCFHPAIRLHRSPLPLFALWQEHQHSGTVARTRLDAIGDTEALLIRRTGEGIELHRLQTPEFLFLDALSRGECLDAAVEYASADAETGPNPGELLAYWVSAGVITDFNP